MRALRAGSHEPYQTQMAQSLTASVVRPLRVLFHWFDPKRTTRPGTVSWHTIGMMVRGEAEYTLYDASGAPQRTIAVGPNTRIWLPRGTVRSVRVGASGCLLYSFQFAIVGTLDHGAYGLPHSLFREPAFEAVRAHDHTLFLFQHLYRLWTMRTPASLLQAQGIALQLIGEMCGASAARDVSPHVLYTIQRLIKFVHENYMNPNLRLDTLAAQTGWSPKYLIHVFRTVMGVTPMEFLQRLRLERATELLEEGTLTVKEVSERVGYKDAAYFARVYRKHTGVPPSKILPPKEAL